MSFCNFCKCRNISDIHHGISWSFNINCFCVFIYITFHIFFPTVDSGKMDPVFRRNIVKKPDASAVQVCIYDQMVSWFKQLHYQSDCCHSSGKSQCIDSVWSGSAVCCSQSLCSGLLPDAHMLLSDKSEN